MNIEKKKTTWFFRILNWIALRKTKRRYSPFYRVKLPIIPVPSSITVLMLPLHFRPFSLFLPFAVICRLNAYCTYALAPARIGQCPIANSLLIFFYRFGNSCIHLLFSLIFVARARFLAFLRLLQISRVWINSTLSELDISREKNPIEIRFTNHPCRFSARRNIRCNQWVNKRAFRNTKTIGICAKSEDSTTKPKQARQMENQKPRKNMKKEGEDAEWKHACAPHSREWICTLHIRIHFTEFNVYDYSDGVSFSYTCVNSRARDSSDQVQPIHYPV